MTGQDQPDAEEAIQNTSTEVTKGRFSDLLGKARKGGRNFIFRIDLKLSLVNENPNMEEFHEACVTDFMCMLKEIGTKVAPQVYVYKDGKTAIYGLAKGNNKPGYHEMLLTFVKKTNPKFMSDAGTMTSTLHPVDKSPSFEIEMALVKTTDRENHELLYSTEIIKKGDDFSIDSTFPSLASRFPKHDENVGYIR